MHDDKAYKLALVQNLAGDAPIVHDDKAYKLALVQNLAGDAVLCRSTCPPDFGQPGGMNHQANLPISDPPRSEPNTTKELSTRAFHKYICFVITILGVLFQLKQGSGKISLFDTDYTSFVILIVAIIVYGGSLICGTYIRQARLNLDLAIFMDKISLLFGALVLVLELVILVPALGLSALLFWIVCFVSFIAVYSYAFLKTLFTRAVGGVVHAFENLKEYLSAVCCFAMESDEGQTGLS
ncbi:unnamed protein product [Prunus armeniaca]